MWGLAPSFSNSGYFLREEENGLHYDKTRPYSHLHLEPLRITLFISTFSNNSGDFLTDLLHGSISFICSITFSSSGRSLTFSPKPVLQLGWLHVSRGSSGTFLLGTHSSYSHDLPPDVGDFLESPRYLRRILGDPGPSPCLLLTPMSGGKAGFVCGQRQD